MDLNAGQPFIFQKFGCPVCGARFASLHDKKVHIRTEHHKGGHTSAQ